jgi:cyclase
MVKRRLIPVLFIKNGLIVRSEGFSYHQNIGNVINEARRYNEWNVDELIYIDISREAHYDLRRDDHRIESHSSIGEIIQAISRVCFMPLTFGGGIRTLEDVKFRIRNGADKITLNTGAFTNPDLIKQASEAFGNQCVVISIDYRMIDKVPTVFTEFGQKNTGVSIFDWAKECERLGAGELFLNAIDRDGKASGYDIETIGAFLESSRLPVIACGGAGTIDDFVDLFRQTTVSGIAAGNMFHFTEHSYERAKDALRREKFDVR